MVGPRSVLPWVLRMALLFGLLAALSLGAPSRSLARPFPTDPGFGETGDPTADDVPSPTPKPKSKTVLAPRAVQATNHDATLVRGPSAIVRIPWGIYLRLLARYWGL
jgi:hypothetical protein